VEYRVKRLVLDVMKLRRDHPLHEFALCLGSIPHVEEARVSLVEIDQQTETVKVTLEGEDVDVDVVQQMIKDHGATIHSIDEVVVVRKNV